ncbi:hypothetical protein GCM10010211_82530 [Streptomyces albospinus]|uniref:CHAT domain-containing protein n=1 Tax=Streptomyces albospinus TaxID=285515 RepID=A0ABQ2VQG8_9ACTN|nr:CHAT domain-containing protein [Streptomyces albospinus]GGV02712.1 hypothetical protein GCM10010211_82530 [Streptomyces albospinus]
MIQVQPLLEMIEMGGNGGQDDQLLSALAADADRFKQTGDRGREAAARFELGRQLFLRDRGDAAHEHLRRAGEILEEDGLAVLAGQAFLGCGQAHMKEGRQKDSLQWFDRAISQFVRGRDEDGEVEASAAKLEALADLKQWSGTELSSEVIAATDHTDSSRLLVFRLAAFRYRMQERLAERDPEGGLGLARQAADIASRLGNPYTEAIFRLALAHNLQQVNKMEEAAKEYEQVLAVVQGLPDAAELEKEALVGLGATLDGDIRTGADRFLQLAQQYATSGNIGMEAQCRYQRAQALGRGQSAIDSLVRSGDTSALVDLRKERAAEFERAAERFVVVGYMRDAGWSWYQAGLEYSWLAPEYREKCYSTCGRAAECLGAAGDWWGKGLAEFVAGQALRTDTFDSEPDTRFIPALCRAEDAFKRADRPVEAAAARMTIAVVQAQSDAEEWMTTAVEALHACEQARPSLRIPKDREINDRTIVANGVRVLTSKLTKPAVTMSDDPMWSKLVWLLSESPKARSFQDQQLQDDTWSRLAADDNALSELMTRRKDLKRELTSLKRMIKAAFVAGRPESDVQTMKEELRQKESWLADIGQQVARRFQRLDHDAPERIELLSTTPVSPEELQTCLEPGEAYIGYRWNAGAPLRSIVTRTTATAGLATGVSAAFAKEAAEASRDGENLPCNDSSQAGRLIGPISADIDTLIISPESLLLGLPWHQLPSPTLTDPDATLGERYTISIVPAAGVLRHLRNNRPDAARARRDTAYLGVACDGGGDRRLLFVDQEVKATKRNHFADEPAADCLTTADCGRFLERGCSASLLHLACHAEPHGLLLSCDGIWTRPIDLLNTPGRTFGADILLLTGCSAGDFSREENNEFLGVVRQLIMVTGARAAVASVAPVPDPAGVLFADLFVSALNGKSPNRPWPTPSRPHAVAQAVAWAQQTMRRRLRAEDAKTLITGYNNPQPADPAWWSPWFVVGDPKATTSGGRTT